MVFQVVVVRWMATMGLEELKALRYPCFMQDRYAGDIGDYVKLALLRALAPGRNLGIGWWLFPDGGPVGDGRHVDYLRHPGAWRHFDSDLFDALELLVNLDQRSVTALERCLSLPDATYHSEPIAIGVTSAARRAGRAAWFERCKAALEGCDLVFLDPDSGLEPGVYSTGSRQAGKAVGLEELQALRGPGRTLIVYHHQTRRKGGHAAEIAYWADRLRDIGFDRVDAIRAGAFSPRVFFLLDADRDTRDRAEAFARTWHPHVRWYRYGLKPTDRAIASAPSETGRFDLTADEIIDGLREWASKMPPGMGEHCLHGKALEALRGMGAVPNGEYVLKNGDHGTSRIDIYVPCAEAPHLLIEIKATGDWRRIAEATWQLYQASALLGVATKRVAICGTPIEDGNLLSFLQANGVALVQVGAAPET